MCVREYLVLVKLELYCRIVSSRKTTSLIMACHLLLTVSLHSRGGPEQMSLVSCIIMRTL